MYRIMLFWDVILHNVDILKHNETNCSHNDLNITMKTHQTCIWVNRGDNNENCATKFSTVSQGCKYCHLKFKDNCDCSLKVQNWLK